MAEGGDPARGYLGLVVLFGASSVAYIPVYYAFVEPWALAGRCPPATRTVETVRQSDGDVRWTSVRCDGGPPLGHGVTVAVQAELFLAPVVLWAALLFGGVAPAMIRRRRRA